MRNSIFFVTLFAVALSGACGNTKLENPNPQLNVCEPDQVDDLFLRVTQGSATVKVTQVTYMNDQSFNTSIRYDVSVGDVIPVPFCFKQGDVRFQVEVTPSGPGVLYGYEYSVEIYYEVALPNADIKIWDNAGLINSGYGSAGISNHTNGETDYYAVGIEWSQM